ncbi:RidA family protein [Hoeflea poritis]|uniref:RidA family protein n=1 Tax=Hoeflea poritis TaxID=2993659 RepID=A0ABT4VH69_9HYPH|nr:RidA family protein [Hoeflea poritis]MDA4843954.1 RidA family protein [Hoeflea poritis]
MSETIASRLAALGIELPEAAAPAANYVPYTIVGTTLYISGQLPLQGGTVMQTGHLASDADIERGQEAARLCAINILAQAKSALGGDLEGIGRLAKIQGFVASAPGFDKQHLVINGASDLLVDVLGERGIHARAAVGMAALPLNASVEVDAIFAIGRD